MRKNFLLTVAIVVTAFLVGTVVAQAASVKWGGELRPRAELVGKDFNDDTNSDLDITARIRLNASVDITPDTSAFIQLEHIRDWGDANGALNQVASDTGVGLHQAYFTLKNFASLPVDLKMGRQQVVLDGHRLFGHTGWANGAASHDAVRLTHAAGNHTLALIYSRAKDASDQTGSAAAAAASEVDAYIIYGNMKGILGGALSVYFVALVDDCGLGNGTACAGGVAEENNIYTLGGRQAGQLYGIDYRAEGYYQFGDAETSAAGVAGGYAATGTGSMVDRSAYMLGVRLGKTFKNTSMKPSITLWYDYLSGTSDSDAASGDFNTFNTLFDTGHKFYGLMDQFVNGAGSGSRHLGLVDYAVKLKVSPAKAWTLKADFHHFATAEDADASPLVSGIAAAGNGNDLGQELDLTLVHKYNANTTISAGYSHFYADDLMNSIKGATDDGDWAYLQFDVKF